MFEWTFKQNNIKIRYIYKSQSCHRPSTYSHLRQIPAHTLVRVAPLDDPTTRGQHRYCAKHREGNPYLDGAFAKDITIVDGWRWRVVGWAPRGNRKQRTERIIVCVWLWATCRRTHRERVRTRDYDFFLMICSAFGEDAVHRELLVEMVYLNN